MSAYIVFQAARLGAPVPVLLRMLLNVGVETLVGALPLVGDLFDAGWKANARNLALLKRSVLARGPGERGSAAVVGAVAMALLLLIGGLGLLAFFAAQAIWTLVTQRAVTL